MDVTISSTSFPTSSSKESPSEPESKQEGIPNIPLEPAKLPENENQSSNTLKQPVVPQLRRLRSMPEITRSESPPPLENAEHDKSSSSISSLELPKNSDLESEPNSARQAIKSKVTKVIIESDPFSFGRRKTEEPKLKNPRFAPPRKNSVLGSSFLSLTSSNFFDKPLLWADSMNFGKVANENELADEATERTSSSLNQQEREMINEWTLRLPKHLAEKFFDEFFDKNIWVIRCIFMVILIAGIYQLSKGLAQEHLPAVVIVLRCLFIAVTSVTFLHSFQNRVLYKKFFSLLFIMLYTLYFITIAIEFYETDIPYIIFFSVLVFTGMYATGCFSFLTLAITNAVHLIGFTIFLLAIKEAGSLIALEAVYVMMVLFMGAAYLYLLERSRKENFVYRTRLERQSERLQSERTKSERLLLNVFPTSVAKNLKSRKQLGTIISETYTESTVLFADIVGFTQVSASHSPKELVNFLNSLFSEFDDLCTKYGMEKIKTIGDAYVAVGGLPTPNPWHAFSAVMMGLDMVKSPKLSNNPLGARLGIRVGIGSGSVIAGVIGMTKWCYDIYGETVADAERLEATGHPGRVHVSEATFQKLPKDTFQFEEVKHMNLSGICVAKTYYAEKKDNNFDWTFPSQPCELSPREVEAEQQDKEESLFREKSRMNQFTLRFKQPQMETIYRKYSFNNFLKETRVITALGLALHILFGIMDVWVDIDSARKTWILHYVGISPIFLAYLGFSYTQRYKKVFEASSVVMAVWFGIGTVIVTALSTETVFRFSITRICIVFLWIVAFFPLSLPSVVGTCGAVFIAFNIAAFAISNSLQKLVFTTNYGGLVVGLVLLIFSTYIMEREIRKSFVLKRRVRFKGLSFNHEQKKSDQLLQNIFPTQIATKLKDLTMDHFIAESYKEVSCMFIRVIGVEENAKSLTASDMLSILNAVFTEFDRLCSAYQLEKIKTVGSCYLVVGGISPNENHVTNMAEMALRVKKLISNFKRSPFPLDVQIGMHVGPCVAGIIGTKKFSFDLWGDTVNSASRMESHGRVGHIQLSEEVAQRLADKYVLHERGSILVKGKGTMITYWLVARRSATVTKPQSPTDEESLTSTLPNIPSVRVTLSSQQSNKKKAIVPIEPLEHLSRQQ